MDEQRPGRRPQMIRITLSEIDPADDPRYIEVVHDTITIGIQIGGEPSAVERSVPAEGLMALESLETRIRAEAAEALNQANAALQPVDPAAIKPGQDRDTLVIKAKRTLIDHIATGTKEGVKWAVRLLVSLAAGS